VSRNSATRASLTCCALGSQPAGDLVINPVASCHYFLPGRRLPSQLKSITAPWPWPVPNYTVWWQRQTDVNRLHKAITVSLSLDNVRRLSEQNADKVDAMFSARVERPNQTADLIHSKLIQINLANVMNHRLNSPGVNSEQLTVLCIIKSETNFVMLHLIIHVHNVNSWWTAAGASSKISWNQSSI